MGKQEKITWLTCAVTTAASLWVGWLLWRAWPDTAAFQPERGEPLMWLVYLLLAVIFLAQHRWRPQEPFADERDRPIMHAGDTQGFAALALMNLVLGVVLVGDDGLLLARLDADWVRYALLLQVAIAFSIASGYRIVRYRLG